MFCSKILVEISRRHDLVRHSRNNAFPKLGFLGLAWNDGRLLGFSAFERVLGHIKTQLPLALMGIWAVAGETVLREDGSDVAIKDDPFLRSMGNYWEEEE